MLITVYNSQRALRLSSSRVKKLTQKLLSHFNVECDELSISFVSKKKIQEMHAIFFDDPSPTDCMTFPIDRAKKNSGGYWHLGEIVVCPQVACEVAKKLKKNPYTEISLYIVHGLLHLLGYDDQSALERKKMRSQERRSMLLLKKNHLILC